MVLDGVKVMVFKGYSGINSFMIDEWIKLGKEAVKRNGSFRVALAGGKTPRKTYHALAVSRKIDFWDKTRIFLTDEHFVPYSSKFSNYRMLKETLLANALIPGDNIHKVLIKGAAAVAAKAYEKDIIKAFSLRKKELPAFDLMILGIGQDGHTASLLPGNPVLKERRRLAAAVRENNSKEERVTLTLPVINSARRVMFLATGKNKAGIIKSILKGGLNVPASLVKPGPGRLLYVLDKKAA